MKKSSKSILNTEQHLYVCLVHLEGQFHQNFEDPEFSDQDLKEFYHESLIEECWDSLVAGNLSVKDFYDLLREKKYPLFCLYSPLENSEFFLSTTPCFCEMLNLYLVFPFHKLVWNPEGWT